MRYSPHQKRLSRDRILEVASRQFRERGGEAVRVSDVMEAAGLTVGGFYKHFADKNQLLEEAVEVALAQIAETLKTVTEGVSRGEALRRVIAMYLSDDHMRHPEVGCALAAMGTELARMPDGMKRAVGRALDTYADRLDFLMPGETAEQRKAAFLVLFPSMAGCVMTARAHPKKERQRMILASGRAFFEQAFCGETAPTFLEVSA